MPTYKSSTLKPLSTNPRGFALVIALSLMSFVLLLVLSLSALLQVENSTATISAAELEARMNAQLGAMIALGDLQRYTGPDQRVTARADILLAPGETGRTGQERWTGVWSSKSNINDPLDGIDGLNNRQPVWLVSGENPNAYSAIGTNAVALATVGKSVIDKSAKAGDDTVRVETEAIVGSEAEISGRYAYWVSDEGIKARVNLSDPHLDSSDPDADYYRNAMAQVADPTAVSNFEGKQILSATESRWKKVELDPASITSLKNIPMFLEPDLGDEKLDSVNREFFHDFTVHSSGVLANVKDGGLKRDLSTALLDLPKDLEDELLFEPHGNEPSPGDPGGPTWKQLANFFKASLEEKSGDPNQVEFRMPTEDQPGIVPVVTRWVFIYHPFAAFTSDTPISDGSEGFQVQNYSNNYEYSIGILPLITLWNPYDKDLVIGESDEDAIGVECEFFRDAVWRRWPRSNDIVCDIRNAGNWSYSMPVFSNAARAWVLRFKIKGLTIPAGEALNFSPPLNSYYQKVVAADGAGDNYLVPGASGELVNGFFSVPKRGEARQGNLNNPAFTGNSGAGFGFYNQAAGMVANPALQLNHVWQTKNSGGDLGSTTIQNGTMTRQLLNLYYLPNVSGDWQDVDRFKALSFRGPEKTVYENKMRSVLLNRAITDPDAAWNVAPITFDDAINPKGASKNANFNDGLIDLTDFNTFKFSGKALRGVTAVLKFPMAATDAGTTFGYDLPSHLYGRLNPTSPVSNSPLGTEKNQFFNKDYSLYTRGPASDPSHWAGNPNVPPLENLNFAAMDEAATYVGLGDTFSNKGSKQAVLFEIPDKPIISVGQLMHANLSSLRSSNSGGEFNQENHFPLDNMIQESGGKNTNRFHAYAAPAHAIGNSMAPVSISLSQTKDFEADGVNLDEAQIPAMGASYDYSYELNAALWDRFFFSGHNNTSPTYPLPNSRLRFWDEDTSSASLALENEAAAHLLLAGGFNINSTSVAAWESVLGAMREIPLPDGTSSSEAEQKHPFARFTKPLSGNTGSLPGSTTDKAALAAGYRSLTDAQISALATELVAEIRRRTSALRNNGFRHPFLSLADFINRSLVHSTKSYALSGAIQAAIDRTDINGSKADSSGLWNATETAALPNYAENDLKLENRPLTEGMPGFLMQADLLSKIGSILQARSDTFTIRAYGSAENPVTNAARSRAYFEITVQRLPAYIDATNLDYEAANSPLNQSFGRRYKIISERYLGGDEI